jgi:hypothetical protein
MIRTQPTAIVWLALTAKHTCMELRIGTGVNGLNARRVIYVGDSRNVRARHLELGLLADSGGTITAARSSLNGRSGGLLGHAADTTCVGSLVVSVDRKACACLRRQAARGRRQPAGSVNCRCLFVPCERHRMLGSPHDHEPHVHILYPLAKSDYLASFWKASRGSAFGTS